MKEIFWTDLEDKIEGELSLDEATLQKHSEDASVYSIKPLAVLFPKNKNDIKEALNFCCENSVPIMAWGAGTSRGGQPLGKGLIINFRKYIQKILSYNEKTGALTVEPGAFYSEVQKFLQQENRSFPPDPSYHQCTIGGMVANNAAGIHSVKYGGTVNHVLSMEYMTIDGEIHHTSKKDKIEERVHALLREHWIDIQKDFPKVEKNSAGYNLNLCYKQSPLDEAPQIEKLLCGSEGTLGIITEITLGTVPIPKATSLIIAYFKTLNAALEAALHLRSFDVAACELVDKVLLDLHAVSAHKQNGDASLPTHAKKIEQNIYLDRFYELESEAVLLIEFEGETPEAASNSAWAASKSLIGGRHLAQYTSEVKTEEDKKLAWDLRRHSSPILNKLEDGKVSIKPLWAVEDVSLPKDKFIIYVDEQKKIFNKYKLVCSFFGHAASANLHIDPVSVDPRVAMQDATIAEMYQKVAEESYALVISLGGSISGEHGDGILRTPYLRKQYPLSYPIFQEIKNIFDPFNLLNPGKIVEFTV